MVVRLKGRKARCSRQYGDASRSCKEGKKRLKKHNFFVIKGEYFHMFRTCLTLLLCAVPAVAVAGHRRHAPDAVPAALDALPPCTCRAEGRSYDMGDEICMATPEGRRIVRCGMVINMPSWTPTERNCDPPTQ